MNINCKVEAYGRMGKVVRTIVLGLKKSKGIVVKFFDDGSQKMFLNGQLELVGTM